jgi:hypothetical protein
MYTSRTPSRRPLRSLAVVVTLATTGLALAACGPDEAAVGSIVGGNDDSSATTEAPDPAPASTAPATGENGETGDDPETTMAAEPPGSVTPVDALDLPAAAEPLADDQLVAAVLRPAGSDPAGLELVVLSDEGEEVTTIESGLNVAEGGAYDLTLTPDRRTLLYAEAGSACTTSVRAVPVDGSSESVEIADAANLVAVAPSGDRIAVDSGDLCGVAERTIDVIPIDGGDRISYPIELGEGERLDSLAFADDSILLVARATDTGGTLHALELETGQLAELAIGGPDATFLALDEAADGTVTAVRVEGDVAAPSSVAVVVIDGGAIVSEAPVEATTVVDGALVSGKTVIVARGDELRLVIDGTEVATMATDIES